MQFHVTTTTVVGLKRIADARGFSVPELCRQVVGVFVAQQEGELGALLTAEAEVADYRPSLGQSYRPGWSWTPRSNASRRTARSEKLRNRGSYLRSPDSVY